MERNSVPTTASTANSDRMTVMSSRSKEGSSSRGDDPRRQYPQEESSETLSPSSVTDCDRRGVVRVNDEDLESAASPSRTNKNVSPNPLVPWIPRDVDLDVPSGGVVGVGEKNRFPTQSNLDVVINSPPPRIPQGSRTTTAASKTNNRFQPQMIQSSGGEEGSHLRGGSLDSSIVIDHHHSSSVSSTTFQLERGGDNPHQEEKLSETAGRYGEHQEGGGQQAGAGTQHRRNWSGGLNMVEQWFFLGKQPSSSSVMSAGDHGQHYGSIEDETMSFHEKNQAFLREARLARERQQREWEREIAKKKQKQQEQPISTPYSMTYQRSMMSTLPVLPIPILHRQQQPPKKKRLTSWDEEGDGRSSILGQDVRKKDSIDQLAPRGPPQQYGVVGSPTHFSNKDEHHQQSAKRRQSSSSGARDGDGQWGDTQEEGLNLSQRSITHYLSSSSSTSGSSSGSFSCLSAVDNEPPLGTSSALQQQTEPGLATQETTPHDDLALDDDLESGVTSRASSNPQNGEAKKNKSTDRKKKKSRRKEIEKILIEELKKQKMKKKRRSRKDREKEYFSMLDQERSRMMEEWKAEFIQAEREAASQSLWNNRIKERMNLWHKSIFDFLTFAEAFLSNLPLTIGACGLAWVTCGVVWFKFAEENLDSCTPVHFFSPRCTFPEFPGCFICHDKDDIFYRLALYFHLMCHVIGGACALSVFAKTALAWRVVVDELSNPTTSTPMGLICITLVCVFAGRFGSVGKAIVLTTSFAHVCLVFWFFSMAFKSRILPDPSWYPNTVGCAYAAIKTFLYYPMAGTIIMVICFCSFCITYPMSMIRVYLNRKISAPVCWIQMSAPSITLYALTILAQPTTQEEILIETNMEELTQFQLWHRKVYLPLMHFMFILSVLGAMSSLHSLYVRYDTLRNRPFAASHIAFCFPTLSHSNAVQAYRGAIDAFQIHIPPGSWYKMFVYTYWMTFLVGGTIVLFILSYKFFSKLPEWTTRIDVSGEEEPPPPNQTMIHDLAVRTGETMRQPYVSPAVLVSNEAGALVRVRRGHEDWRGPYVRTRQVTSLGFEPIMDWSELNHERDVLLDWVAKNPPKLRKRTRSVPHLTTSECTAIFDDDNADGNGGRARHARHETFGTFTDIAVGRTLRDTFHRRGDTFDDRAPWLL